MLTAAIVFQIGPFLTKRQARLACMLRHGLGAGICQTQTAPAGGAKVKNCRRSRLEGSQQPASLIFLAPGKRNPHSSLLQMNRERIWRELAAEILRVGRDQPQSTARPRVRSGTAERDTASLGIAAAVAKGLKEGIATG